MNIEQKVFKFTEWSSSANCRELYISESQLEEKHINLLAGEVIKQYENLPEKSREIVKKYFNDNTRV